MSGPVLAIEENRYGTRVRLTVGSAEVWLRATPGGKRLDVSIDEGAGDTEIAWSIRRVDARIAPEVAGVFVQSPRRAK